MSAMGTTITAINVATNTIVVTNLDVATLMPWLSSVKSVLQGWYPGSEGGTATARLVLLSGPYTGLPGNAGGAAFFDDATFSIVPEPASVGAVMLFGALGLVRRRRIA